jgi:hypothetical protein
MANAGRIQSMRTLVAGMILGGIFVLLWQRPAAIAQQNGSQENPGALPVDVAHLKDIVPPHSHPMVEAGMFAANLWFAGEKKNWPLAGYYLNEARNRIRWEVHLFPDPKGPDGKTVDVQAIFDAIDNGTLPKVRKAIEMQDSKEFAVQYKHLLEDCYGCHKAIARPFLRPMVPVSGAQPIVNLDPAATWPQ